MADAPEMIYAYPGHMQNLMRFYGPGLPIRPISKTVSSVELEKIGQELSRHQRVELVLSHDWGARDRLLAAFSHSYGKARHERIYSGIRIYRYESVSSQEESPNPET